MADECHMQQSCSGEGQNTMIRINKEATGLPVEEVTASGEGQDTADKDQQNLKPVLGLDFACQTN